MESNARRLLGPHMTAERAKLIADLKFSGRWQT